VSDIIKRNRVTVAPTPRSVGDAAPTPVETPEAPSQVDVLEDGDLTRIRVTCGCGRVTTIDCDYADDVNGAEKEIPT
jgi:hypothetical protein